MNLASHSSFDKYVLLQFKSGLREQQRELHLSIEQAEKELADPALNDVVKAAPYNSFADSVLVRLSQDRSRLLLVELALERIRDGTFGACADCGAAIGTRRLQAVPWASHCIQCQQQFAQATLAENVSSPQPVSL
jgi:DnaK suppressor protein